MEKDAIYLPPESVEFEVWAGAAMLPYKFMTDAAFAALALADCIWVSAAAAARLGSLDAALTAEVLSGLAAWALAVLEVVLLPGSMLDSV
jgi:hypothetical protein